MREKIGTVTSAKMIGTITVTIHSQKMHPKYKKSFRVSRKFLADSKGFDVAEGDRVRIIECRPLSKRKCFRLAEILISAPRVSAMAEEKGIESGGRHPKNVPAKSPKPQL